MTDPFDQIPPEGETLFLPKPEEPEVDAAKMADRMEKLFNMLASENENERAVAASKIAGIAAIMQMPVWDAVRRLLGVSKPSPATVAPEPDFAAAAAYTAAGVPVNQRKRKGQRHDIDRLAEAYRQNAGSIEPALDEHEHAQIGYVLELDYDWQLSRWEKRFVRSMTKRLLAATAEPLL